MQAEIIAACCGFEASRLRMKSANSSSAGQSMPSACAVRCSRWTSRGSGGGRVRRKPTRAYIISEAAAKPVSSDIWAFHCSTGSRLRYSSDHSGPAVSTSCSGRGSDTPPRAGLALEPALADLLEQPQRLVGGALVDRLLRARVVQLGPRPDPRPLDLDVGPGAVAVEPDRPEQGRPELVGEQRAAVLGDHRRVQRHPAVGAVQRLAAAVRLQVDRVAGGDERRQVGDGVVQHVAVAVALEVQGLVEVLGAGRVDGDQRQVGAVEVGSRGFATAASAAACTSAGNSGLTSSSRWISAMPSRSTAGAASIPTRPWAARTRTTRLLDMTQMSAP